ncbi:MAG: pyridoxal phosphate-dependent aminotransferase [Ruegeria sp.]
MINAVPHIAAMSPYALADLNPPEGQQLVSLSQNESFRPPSPFVAEAVSQAVSTGHLYPDPDWKILRERLSDVYNVSLDRVLCGNGSMELISALVQAFANEHNSVLAPAHAYPFFRSAAQLVRARYDTAPEVDQRVSVDNLIAAVQPDTRIVFVANPGNPTGTRLSRADLLRLRSELSGDILLVIDEAYGEFSDHLNERMFDVVDRGDTVVLRTFSKAYGLAGLRVGWGLFPPEIAADVRKALNPNNISVAGQAAAFAALNDQEYMRETCQITAQRRDWFSEWLRSLGLRVPTSFSNFALIQFASNKAAQEADRMLRSEGVFLRPQGGAGLDNCLRATIGSHEEMDLVVKLLEHWTTENAP